MTPTQFSKAIGQLGLDQSAAARCLGVNPRTVRRWIADERSVPEPVAKLLRLMLERGIKPEEVK